MRINMSAKPAVFPMPVLMVGTYDENGTVDVMMACWGITYRNLTILNPCQRSSLICLSEQPCISFMSSTDCSSISSVAWR